MKSAEWLGYRKAVLLIALLATLAQAVNLVHVARSTYSTGEPSYTMYDTSSYLLGAEALMQGRGMPTAFRERPLLPALIAASRLAGLPDWCALWPSVLLQFPACLACAYLAWYFTKRSWPSTVAAALYATLPDMFQYLPLLGTDAMNAQCMVIGTATMVAWSGDGARRTGVASVLSWMMAQLVRPTFFMIPGCQAVFFLPLLMKPGRRAAALLFLAACCVVPASQVAINKIYYDVASPTLALPELYQRVLVPKIKTEMRVHGRFASRTDIWVEERDILAVQDPDWQALHCYDIFDHDKAVFRKHYDAVVNKHSGFVQSNRQWLVRGIGTPLYGQIFTPPRFHQPENLQDVNPAQDRLLLKVHKLGIIFFLLGTAVLLRSRPLFVLFMAGIAALVFAPMVFMMWLRSSGRLPVEVLALPVVAFGLTQPLVWCGALVCLVAGYLPIPVFGFGENWLVGVIVVAFAALLIHSVHVSWRGWLEVSGRTLKGFMRRDASGGEPQGRL